MLGAPVGRDWGTTVRRTGVGFDVSRVAFQGAGIQLRVHEITALDCFARYAGQVFGGTECASSPVASF